MGSGEPVKRIVGIALTAAFVLGAVAFFLVQSAEETVTTDMVARAGRFAIPADVGSRLRDEDRPSLPAAIGRNRRHYHLPLFRH